MFLAIINNFDKLSVVKRRVTCQIGRLWLQSMIVAILLSNIYSEMHAQTLSWAKSMGGILFDEGYAIAVGADGSVYTTGYFYTTAMFDSLNTIKTTGISDMFISKSDASGNLLWVKSIGGAFAYVAGTAIALDDKDNVFLTGYYTEDVDFDPGPDTFYLLSTNEDVNIFLCKLDANGQFVWAKNMSGNGIGSKIKLDSIGNIYLMGNYEGSVDFDPGPTVYSITSAGLLDQFICKLDTSGQFIWVKSLINDDFGVNMAMDVDDFGNLYIVGNFNNSVDFNPGQNVLNLLSNGQNEIFICKLSKDGNFIWTKTIGGGKDNRSFDIVLDGLTNVYISGFFRDTVDFDPGQGSNVLVSLSGPSFYIVKLDSNGNFKWIEDIKGPINCRDIYLVVDAMENIIATGTFQGMVDFNLGPGVPPYVSAGNLDVFVSKYDSEGTVMWAGVIGGPNTDISNAIACDQNGNIFITGLYNATADFDLGQGTYLMTSAGRDDIYILKMTGSTVGTNQEVKSLFGIRFYPNPVQGHITIDATSNLDLLLYNLHGQVVLSRKVQLGKSFIDLDRFEAGIYFLKSTNLSGITFIERLIISK